MNRIDAIRRKQNLSYKNLAEKTGLTATYIHLLAKNKRRNPSLEAMQKIALALGEKVERVFRINEKEGREKSESELPANLLAAK